MTRFRLVSADPPWPFEDDLPGAGRGAAAHYPLLTELEIAGFLGHTLARLDATLAPDAYLALWRVGAMVEMAYRIGRAWGFEPKAEIVWKKLTRHGKRWFGMGRQVRAEHETAILMTRGSPKPAAKNIRTIFEAKVPLGDEGIARHSAKPEEFYDLLERLSGRGPYLELFARRQRPGWVCVGNEIPTMISPRRRG